MHSTIKQLNKPRLKYCKKCLSDIYNKSKDLTRSDSDICMSITRTETLENDTIVRLHKLNSIIEESNNLIS
jgi:hypothetical protein